MLQVGATGLEQEEEEEIPKNDSYGGTPKTV
jgi:hypothetical protein